MRNRVLALAAVLLCGALASQAVAGDLCCDHCGSSSKCRVICRLVCDTRPVIDHCYDCFCEDFCIPGPSCRGDCNCECVHVPGPAGPPACGCEHCCDKGTAAKLKWYHWIPGCAKVHKRKVLVKYEVVKEVPAYHWVTECVCDDCGCCTHLDTRPAEMPADLPPPPPPLDDHIVPTSAQFPVAQPNYDQPSGQAPSKKRSLLDMLLGN